MPRRLYNIAIVGATGLVGSELMKALEERRFPVQELALFSSMAMAGEKVEFMGEEFTVLPMSADFYRGMDLVFFTAHPMVSRDLAEESASDGCIVIDSSRTFRLDPLVPLVVPEVNPQELKGLRDKKGIVASPGPLATALALVLNPVLKKYGIKRIVAASTHGSTSGGRMGFEEHQQQTISIFNQREIEMDRFVRQSAFNIYPRVGPFTGDGTEEENDIERELPKILGENGLAITVTSAMVPIFCGVSAAVNVETRDPVNLDSLREIISDSPGVMLMDRPSQEEFPDTLEAMAHDEVMVGRLRKDPTMKNGFNLWISADNLRKGSALNMVQIAETILGL
jgi:aspartate-semialdehyde dehydrogenase